MVECANCGLLTARSRKTQELVEVDIDYRTKGIILDRYDELNDGPAMVYEPTPMCLARKYALESELPRDWLRELYIIGINDRLRNQSARNDLVSVLNKPRLCNRFIRWEQGFTPKEHLQSQKDKQFEEWKLKAAQRTARHTVIAGAAIGSFTALILKILDWALSSSP